MATRISGSSSQSILSSDYGLDRVLDRPSSQSHLPKNMSYVSVGNTEVHLENMYKKGALDKRMMSKARPSVENPDEFEPAVFSMNYDNAVEKLSTLNSPEIRRFVHEVANPLNDNAMLLKIYKGFMVGG